MTPLPSVRRPWIGILSAATLALFAGSAWPDDSARPNVLFIAVDDLNDWVGQLGGYDGVQTPNLDRIAKQGVTFTRAYCSAPACNPSRASLMTGLSPSTTGVYLNGQPWRPVLPDAVTLAQHFRANGYRVEGGGKIYHSSALKSIYNDPPSWDAYFDKPADPMPKNRPLNGIPNTAHFDWGPVSVADEQMGDYKTVSWAAEFLKTSDEQPFFLAVGLYRPHLPWYVPQTYFDQYPLEQIKIPEVPDDELDDIPPAGFRMARRGDHRRVTESNNWEKAVQGYLASIAFADAQIGRLLDALERSDHRDNTIIVLWSDHGWHLGEKHHWRKFALWEEACRVVLKIAVPQITPPGARCERTVSLVDLYPTLIELCGLPARPELDGQSLAPLLKEPNGQWDRPALTTHGRKNHALRSERYRYIRYADGSEELYDHQTDPREWKNLASLPDYQRVKDNLKRWLPTTDAPNAPREQRR